MDIWKLSLESLPFLRVAGRFALTDRNFSTIYRGQTHAVHLHGYSGKMQLSRKIIDIAPGDVTISPAGEQSSYDLDAPGRHWCIHLETAPVRGGIFAPIALHIPGCSNLRERFAHIAGLYATESDPIAHSAARVSTQELLLTLARMTTPLPEDDAPARAAAFIDANFERPITVRDVAAAAGRSPVYLARLFRRRFGTTVPHRILQRRAGHARFLLESTDLPIWRVAERCGIPDPQRFNKTMHALLGASPSAIRESARGPVLDPDR